jgi:hypothetical protein
MAYNNSSNSLFRNQLVRSVTAASYTALGTDTIIEVNFAGAVAITLPAPATTGTGSSIGKLYIVKDISGAASTNNITLTPASGLIDGAASASIASNYGALQIFSDGTNYFSYGIVNNASTAWRVAAAGLTMVPGNSYLSTAATAQSFPLPATASVGTLLELSMVGAGIVTITQAAGQQIRFGNLTTTSGVGGSLASTSQGDSVKLVCTTANTIFQVVTGAVGNWTVT